MSSLHSSPTALPSALLPVNTVNPFYAARYAALRGSIIHSISFEEIELIEDGLLIFDPSNGIIQGAIDLEARISRERRQQLLDSFGDRLQDFTGKLLVPGFIDAHCHAPQYVFTGTGMDLPLLAWLEKYTFPCEARFSDVDFAKVAYAKSIQRHLKCGTTFASYFATIHNEAGKVLVDVINRVGQRAFVGKVSMDRNSPDFYIEDTEEGCRHAEEFAQYVLSLTPQGRLFLEALQQQGSATLCNSVDTSTVAIASLRGTNANESSCGVQVDATACSKRPRTVSIADGVSRSSSLQNIAVLTATAMSSARSTESDTKKARTLSMSSLPDVFTDYSSSSSALSAATAAGTLMNSGSYGFFDCDDDGDDISQQAAATAAAMEALVSGSLLNLIHTPLVMPCITPRFVPTCTGPMMQSLGDIAARYGLPVQSHLSESVNEIQWVKELHPDCANYADVYRKYGLLHSKVYMAHCCHSDAEERRLLAETGCGVVHCASSNFNLNSGAMDVRQFKREGIKVALGTDVAGGYSPSMLDALRQAIVCSKFQLFDLRKEADRCAAAAATASSVAEKEEAIPNDSVHSRVTTSTDSEEATDDSSLDMEQATAIAATAIATATAAAAVAADYKTLTYKEAFHLATVGGAEVLGMEQVVGNFLPGKKLDCLVIDVGVENGPFDIFDGETAIDHFQKFLFLGDDRNIARVFVDGRCVL